MRCAALQPLDHQVDVSYMQNIVINIKIVAQYYAPPCNCINVCFKHTVGPAT